VIDGFLRNRSVARIDLIAVCPDSAYALGFGQGLFVGRSSSDSIAIQDGLHCYGIARVHPVVAGPD
jgi:hypothetical protein